MSVVERSLSVYMAACVTYPSDEIVTLLSANYSLVGAHCVGLLCVSQREAKAICCCQ